MLVIRNDPHRHKEVAGANRNKTDAPFQYAGSPFAALAAVESMAGLRYLRRLKMPLKRRTTGIV